MDSALTHRPSSAMQRVKRVNPEIAEDLLRAVMGDSADADFPDQLSILRDLAMYKYDDYGQYAPGRQFIAYLAGWLTQFDQGQERRDALRFIQKRLVYISNNEMRHLVSLMAHDVIPSTLQRHLADRLQILPYRVTKLRSDPAFAEALRKSLFLGMSDGARIGQLRRSTGLSNEQFAMTYELNQTRADTMTRALRKDLADGSANFEYIFLVDDISASGRTILRWDDDGALDGRLLRFVRDTLPLLNNQGCPKIVIALYVATPQATDHLQSMIASYPNPRWAADSVPQVLPVMMIKDHARLVCRRPGVEYEPDQRFDELLHKYYDPSVEDEHKHDVKHGYSECGLPLVLSHNTPNNSVYLLWERTKTKPLFPRYERH